MRSSNRSILAASAALVTAMLVLVVLPVQAADAPSVEQQATSDTLLFVRTTPSGADVRLDGKPIGRSNDLLPVKPGTHRIVIDLEGHQPQEQQITFREGKITRIELTLKPRAAGAKGASQFSSADEEKAIAEVEKLGGKVWTTPVLRLFLDNTRATDATLELFKRLSRLEGLYLMNTQVTDAGLKHLEGLPQLQNLYLHGTPITDAGLKHLKGLPRLAVLFLDDTKVTDAGLEQIKGLPQLERLGLTNTKITDAGLEHLRGLKHLEVLSLIGTKTTPEGVKKLRDALLLNCRILQSSDLPHQPSAKQTIKSTRTDDAVNPLSPDEEKAIAEIKKLGGDVRVENMVPGEPLIQVSFRDLQVTDEALLPVEELKNLSGLSVFHTSVTDAGLDHVKGLTQLRTLNLSNRQITDAGIEKLKGLTQLHALWLSSTQVTDAGLRFVVDHFKDLNFLYLYETNITDAGLSYLKGLPRLEYLFLGKTQIDDAGLEHLKTLTQLRTLHVYSTKITNAGLEHLNTLGQLRQLDVSDTQVTDEGIKQLKQALPHCSIIRRRSGQPAPPDAMPTGDVNAAAETNPQREKAIAAIKKLGGTIRIDQQGPGGAFTIVDLHSTGENDALLEQLKALSQLRGLILNETAVTDAGLEYLKGLRQLEFLYLRGTKVSDDGLKCLTGLTQLHSLNFDNTQVTDEGLTYLKHLPQLRSLGIENTRVTEEGLKSFQDALPNCRIRYFRGPEKSPVKGDKSGRRNGPTATTSPNATSAETTSSTREMPANLEQAKALAEIKKIGGRVLLDINVIHPNEPVIRCFLQHTQITDAEMEHLHRFPKLQWLFLDGTQITDAGLDHLQRSAQLRRLGLSGTHISDVGLQGLTRLNQLEALYLDDTRVADAGLAPMRALPQLRFLHLGGTQVTDAGLQHLQACPRLQVLKLNGTHITDAGLEHLKGATHLRQLYVCDTKVTAQGIGKLQQTLPDCEILASNQPQPNLSSSKMPRDMSAAFQQLAAASTELAHQMKTIPELAGGTDAAAAKATSAIARLCEDRSEDRQTLLRLLLQAPAGELSGFRYPLPQYHCAARVLFWLALADKLQGSENLCLAIAIADGILLEIGDRAVREAVRKDSADMVNFFLETEAIQQKLGHKPLRSYPPGALVMLAWRGHSLSSHSCDAALQAGYYLDEIRQEPMPLCDYQRHVLSPHVLRQMQAALMAAGTADQRARARSGYQYYSTANWDFMSDDLPPRLIKLGSQEFPTPWSRSASLIFERRQAEGKGIGSCNDQDDAREALWKSVGIPSMSLKMVMVLERAEGKMFGHILPVYYDADQQAWFAVNANQGRGYPYCWAMSLAPVRYRAFLTTQSGFPQRETKDYEYEIVSGQSEEGGRNQALSSGIPQEVLEKAIAVGDTGPLGAALVSTGATATPASPM